MTRTTCLAKSISVIGGDLAATSQEQLLASMAVKLNSQTRERAELQRQLVAVNQQLANVHKTLAQKDHIIGSLEVDLEHMLEQLTRLQSCNNPGSFKPVHANSDSWWINRTVPGLA